MESNPQRLTSLEAITVVLNTCDNHIGLMRSVSELNGLTPEQVERVENIEIAISTVQAMLNTALPIARFRCFVSVQAGKPPKGPIRDDYTVCSASMAGITAGLIGLAHTRVDVHATVWEQGALGAEMLSGYQGPSKVSRYRSWIESLLHLYPEEVNGTTPNTESEADTGAAEAGSQDQAGAEEGEQGGGPHGGLGLSGGSGG